MQMTEMVRAFPQAAPYVADIMAKHFDWPGADEIAERLEMLNPAKAQQNAGPPPEMLKMQAEMEAKKADAQIKQQQAQADMAAKVANLEMEKEKHALEMAKMRAELDFIRQQQAMKTQEAFTKAAFQQPVF
jgi:multidrug efflux pump subunit AcrA (membrane-fusion protein)